MDNKLPKGWIWAKLDDLGEIYSGGTPSTKDEANFNGNIPWITPADLSGYAGIYISNGSRNISEKGLSSSSATVVAQGSVLFSSRAPIGYVAIAANEVSTNQGFKNLVPSVHIYNKYCYYYLKASKRLAESYASGTTFLELSGTKFAQLPIPLPPFQEQKRIVAKIEELFSELDEGIAALKKAQTELKRYRQAVLKAAFEGKLTEKWRMNNEDKIESKENISKRILIGASKNKTKKDQEYSNGDLHLLDLPPEWCWAKIGDIIEKSQYGTSDKAEEDQKGIVVLRMGNIFEGKLVFNKLKYFPPSWQNSNEFLLEDGDILFNRTNSFELVGKSAVYKKHYPKAVFASYLIKLKPKGDYSSDLISYYINSLFGRKYIVSVVTQQVGQANVNGTKLSRMPIPVMSRSEQVVIQNEIEKRFLIADDTQQTIEKNILECDRLRQSILKKAFEGKLVPQNPSDESAEVLLQKIKQEKIRFQSEAKNKKKKR